MWKKLSVYIVLWSVVTIYLMGCSHREVNLPGKLLIDSGNLMVILGSGGVLLEYPFEAHSAKWSKDQAYIAFNDSDGTLYIFDVESELLSVLSDSKLVGRVWDFKWSPTSDKLVVAAQSRDFDIWQVYVIENPNVPTMDVLWECKGECRALDWTEDGSGLIVAGVAVAEQAPTPFTSVYRVNLITREPTLLFTVGKTIDAIDLSPNGTSLAFVDYDHKEGLFVTDLAGHNIQHLVSNCGGGIWSPDGEWIAYHLLIAQPLELAVQAYDVRDGNIETIVPRNLKKWETVGFNRVLDWQE